MNQKISKTWNYKILNFKYNQKNILFMILIIIIILILFYYIYKYINYKYKEHFDNDKIIIPDIIGGLGNQLYLVAAAFSYSKDNNYKLTLDNRKDVFSYGKPRPTYNDTIFYNIPVLNDAKKDSDFINLIETDYDSSNNSNNSNKNIFLTGGYYQNPKYFNKYRKELLDLLTPTNDTLNKVNEIFKQNNIKLKGDGGDGGDGGDENINSDFLIAIHIRLDDVYTPIDANKMVYDKDEYDLIIEKLPEHVKANPNTKFIIFSNDIPRTKDIFKPAQIDHSKMIYIQSEDYVELALMAKCDAYIASSSTFNWWGIYLNNKMSKDIFVYWKQDSNYRKDVYKNYEYISNHAGCVLYNKNVEKNNIETFSNEKK